jgi:hypothetical protein
MSEKRWEKRHKRRLQLRFGDGDVTTMGLTDDISEEGIFIRTGAVQSPGTLLTIELYTPSNERIVLEAIVQWTKTVPSYALRRGKKGGMGLRILKFVSGEDYYRNLCSISRSDS